MSLLSERMEECVMLERTSVSDGYGGFITSWSEGASLQAAIVYDSSMAAKVASVQGVTDLYTITTSKNINLQYHDVIRRVSDGKTFRVTSKGDDNHTPASASLDMRQVSAEEWEVPDNG